MKRYVVGLIAVLVIAGLWAVVSLDDLARAQSGCASQGAVDPGETALAADCEVLLDIRDTLAGTSTLNWAADTPIGDWDGISAGGNPARVTELSLFDRALSGTIPEQVGNLTALTRLDLGNYSSECSAHGVCVNNEEHEYNRLTGSIPASLARLSNLTELRLGDNQLDGEIPTELGDLSNLTELGLGGNQLTGAIPTQLGNLPSLTGLWLDRNQLTSSIPSQLGNLTNLTVLHLARNQLTGTIPTELSDLSSLSYLNLSQNELTGPIPTQLGNLSNLTQLGLRGNQLSGAIPPELGNLSNLTGLSLRDNELSGAIPPQLGNLSNLELLWLFDNQLSGSIPPELGNLSNLTELRLRGNQLSGTIPRELGNLSNLVTLGLWDNRLSGPVPSELGRLSNLTQLWLNQNELTGHLPRRLTDLTLLESLTFYSNNGLCAPIDNTFQTWLRNVESVRGSSCAPFDSQDDKDVLTEFYNSTNGTNWADNSSWLSSQPIRTWHGVTNDANGRVNGLYLWENGLSGTIPPELGNLSEIAWLILANNQLTGSIPPELGNLSNLTALFLGGNQLTGCIPAALEDVPFNDFYDVGLPFCAPTAPDAPTVTITATTTPMVRIGSPILVAALFSEPVNGFTATDVTVANGDISSFVGSDGSSAYVFQVTPNAVGVVTVDIAAGVAQDSDSDGNAAATQLTLGLPYDDDHDGAIGGNEVLMAVRDYFLDTLSAEHVLQVVSLYFQSSS